MRSLHDALPIFRKHLGAAYNPGTVSSRFTDHRRAFSGNGRLVNGGQPFDDLSISRHGDSCRSEEHTSELQSLMRTSYAVLCLKKKKRPTQTTHLLIT